MDDKKVDGDVGYDKASLVWLWVIGGIFVVAAFLFVLQNVLGGEDVATDVSGGGSVVAFQEAGIYGVEAPATVAPGGFLTVKWTVSAAEAMSIPETSVYWGERSFVGEEFGLNRAPGDSYSEATDDYTGGDIEIPREFEAVIVAPESGVVFFRVYAEIDGEHFWSDEVAVSVDGK